MKILAILLIIAAVVIIIAAGKISKRKEKQLRTGGACIGIVAAILMMSVTMCGQTDSDISRSMSTYAEAQGMAIADILKKAGTADSEILYLVLKKEDQSVEAMVKALKKYGIEKVSIEEYEDRGPEKREISALEITTEGTLSAIDRHPEAKVVIASYGIKREARMSLFNDSNTPKVKLILLNSIQSDESAAFEAGLTLAAFIPNRANYSTDAPSGSADEILAKCFIVATPENYKEILKK